MGLPPSPPHILGNNNYSTSTQTMLYIVSNKGVYDHMSVYGECFQLLRNISCYRTIMSSESLAHLCLCRICCIWLATGKQAATGALSVCLHWHMISTGASSSSQVDIEQETSCIMLPWTYMYGNLAMMAMGQNSKYIWLYQSKKLVTCCLECAPTIGKGKIVYLYSNPSSLEVSHQSWAYLQLL